MSKSKPVQEQVVVVFGASSGIGRATALAFARQGATVVAVSRSGDNLDTLAQQVRDAGGEITVLVADVNHFDEVKRVADTAVSRYNRIDTWVHLAATSIYATFHDTTVDEFRRVLDTNVLGTIFGLKSALPYLAESRGVFIPITSVEAVAGLPYQSAYAASKHALHGLLQVLRLELSHEHSPVRIAEVMPISTDTPFFENAKTKLGVEPKAMPPVHTPEKVAETILRAAVHPKPEIPVGKAGKAMAFGARVAPRATEAVLETAAFRLQRTDKPKSEHEPANMYEPVENGEKIRGKQGDGVLITQIAPWLFAGVALGAVAYTLSKTNKNGNHTPNTPRTDYATTNATDYPVDYAEQGTGDGPYTQTVYTDSFAPATATTTATVATNTPGPTGPEYDPEYQGS